MVSARVAGLASLLAIAMATPFGIARAEEPGRDPSKAVGSALGKGSYPWYDASKDQAKPVRLPWEPSGGPNWNLGWLGVVGNAITLAVFGAALALLVGLMVWLWRRYEPLDSGQGAGSSGLAGEPSRIEALPAGMRREFESSDPWQEALRRRGRGDLAGAVVCLFAHQLLTLSRLGLVRLAPGRTGRQLLRSVVDAEFRTLVHPTLRLFEAVYYGHRTPTPAEFAVVWEQAEAFERRVAGGVAA